MLLLTIFLKRQ